MKNDQRIEFSTLGDDKDLAKFQKVLEKIKALWSEFASLQQKLFTNCGVAEKKLIVLHPKKKKKKGESVHCIGMWCSPCGLSEWQMKLEKLNSNMLLNDKEKIITDTFFFRMLVVIIEWSEENRDIIINLCTKKALTMKYSLSKNNNIAFSQENYCVHFYFDFFF